jgi:hypothetical protein
MYLTRYWSPVLFWIALILDFCLHLLTLADVNTESRGSLAVFSTVSLREIRLQTAEVARW